MSFTTGIYNINDVAAVVNGWTIQAPAGDKPYEVERTTPEDWKKKVGSRGDTTFVYQPDRSGIIKIRVKQNSLDDNKTLDDLAKSGAIFACELSNSVTKEKATSQFSMVGKIARVQFSAADEEELEYEIVCAKIVETRGK